MKIGTGGHANDELAKSIFLDALEIASELDLLAYLDRRCGPDHGLRAEVEALLCHQGQLGDYLERPALDQDATRDLAPPPITEGPGTVIGPYKLREQIGEGGMGVVYVAEQHQPVRRRVALKVIKPGMDSRQVVARFEAERQALAMMDHPNIARVFDGGTTPSGRPYFVMELVRGVPITEYCDEQRLTIRERLELFVLVCRAVQHAHQKGIIHRDLKPSNILITLHDGVPVPKVIDFGVAKATGQALTDKTVYTAFAQLIGTPLYMSPEQVELSGLDVDTRSDIYSLGVLLYELLTGTTPFDQETFRTAAFDEMRRILREQEPPRPSTRLSTLGAAVTTVSANRKADARQLDRTIRGELDWVVMKALEKDRRRRYETANDFASDVIRYLRDQPVQACPPSAGYRLRKFVRRNKGPVVAGLALAALLALGTVGTSLGLVWALKAERKSTEEKERAITAETKAKQAEAQANEEAAVASAVRDFLTDDLLAPAPSDSEVPSNKLTVEQLLARAAARIPGKFAQRPRFEAEIRVSIGGAYLELGDPTAAQPHLERAWEINHHLYGEEHLRTLFFMHLLAVAYARQGKEAQAESLQVKGLEIRRRVLGEEDPETLKHMHNLAIFYFSFGKLAQAEQLLVQELEGRRRVLGEGHPSMGPSMHDLANLYEAQGKYAQAEQLLIDTIEIRRRFRGGEDPETLDSMHRLANFHKNHGELTKAEQLYVKVLEAARRVLGKDHDNTHFVMGMLASVYSSNLKFERSISLLEDLLKRKRDKRGPDHPDSLDVMVNLGIAYLDAGRLPKAIDVLEQARAKAMRIPDLSTDQLADMSARMGEAYERAGQFAKAESLYRETLDTVRQRHNGVLSASAQLQGVLGRSLLKQQRYAEAEPRLREWLKFREQDQPHDWTTFNSKSLLGGSLLGQQKYDEAEPLLLAGYEGMKQRGGTYRPRLTEAIERLVQLYEARGQSEKAAEWRAKLPPTAAELPADVFARPGEARR